MVVYSLFVNVSEQERKKLTSNPVIDIPIICWFIDELIIERQLLLIECIQVFSCKRTEKETTQLNRNYLKWLIFKRNLIFLEQFYFKLSSIRSIDRTLSGTTTPGQSGPGSEGNKGVFHIPQSSSITGASPLDRLVSYPGYWLGES